MGLTTYNNVSAYITSLTICEEAILAVGRQFSSCCHFQEMHGHYKEVKKVNDCMNCLLGQKTCPLYRNGCSCRVGHYQKLKFIVMTFIDIFESLSFTSE